MLEVFNNLFIVILNFNVILIENCLFVSIGKNGATLLKVSIYNA